MYPAMVSAAYTEKLQKHISTFPYFQFITKIKKHRICCLFVLRAISWWLAVIFMKITMQVTHKLPVQTVCQSVTAKESFYFLPFIKPESFIFMPQALIPPSLSLVPGNKVGKNRSFYGNNSFLYWRWIKLVTCLLPVCGRQNAGESFWDWSNQPK